MTWLALLLIPFEHHAIAVNNKQGLKINKINQN